MSSSRSTFCSADKRQGAGEDNIDFNARQLPAKAGCTLSVNFLLNYRSEPSWDLHLSFHALAINPGVDCEEEWLAQRTPATV
jgi:hypothetical protein